MKASVALLVLFSIVATGCRFGPDGTRPEGAREGPSSQDDQRTLVIAMRVEPTTLTGANPGSGGSLDPRAPRQIFHAVLSRPDEKGAPQLQLAEAFPVLGTDNWKVFPDGRMETTWRLRPNLTWHDGGPLVADDFVVSKQFSQAVALPGRESLAGVEEVIAPDPRTVIIRYKSPDVEAGESGMEPLPRHILGRPLEQLKETGEARDALFGLPYFTTEFVGLGPYRLVGWEPGAFITGVAFPDYVNGKPRIGRIQLVSISDENAALANILSGTVHYATDFSVAFEQASVLRQQWAAKGESGSILLSTAKTVYGQPQARPDYANPALLDVRFRQGLAHAIDKEAIVDAVLGGEPGMADTLMAKEHEHYPELNRVLTKYPLDPRRTEQLMAEVGFTKDEQGLYGLGGSRLNLEVQVQSGYVKEGLVLADGWKRAGVETPLRTLSAAEQRDGQIGSIYPGINITQFGIKPDTLSYFSSALASSPATQWLGRNRGGYFNPEIDRLYDVFTTSLDRNERNQASVQGLKILSDQAAYFPLYYGYEIVVHIGNLVGPRGAEVSSTMWNVEEWYWR